MSYQAEYRELLQLTQQFLSQEYTKKESIPTDSNTYAYFKEIYLRERSEVKATSVKPTIQVHKPSSYPQYVKPKMELSPPLPESKVPQQNITKKSLEKPISAELKAPEDKRKAFDLEFTPNKYVDDLKDMKGIIKELFPNQIILESVLEEPKKEKLNISQFLSNCDVLILSSNCSEAQDTLLSNLVNALIKTGKNCINLSILKLNQDDLLLLSQMTFKLIISEEAMILSSPINSYRLDHPPRLGHSPLLIIQDLNALIKNPQLKKPLWSSIQSHLE